MALIVEDGSGIAGAESYLSVAAADTYLADRNLDAVWTLKTTAQKEGALRQATEYLDSRYSWIGDLTLTTQPLDWPRSGAYDSEYRDYTATVPVVLARATAELAVASLEGRLLANTTRSAFTRREKVGQLEVEYSPSAPTGTNYPFVSSLLKDIITGGAGGNQTKLKRV